MRDCETCDACCIIPSIDHPSLQKEARVVCPHLDLTKETHKCMIYENRPKEPCEGFNCSWLMGFGSEDDQPNKNKLLTFVAEFNNGVWIVAVEMEPNSFTTTGKNMLLELVKTYNVPVIVELYDSKNPTGDLTIIKNSLYYRTSKMRGALVGWLDDDQTIGIYELINTGK